MHGEHSRETALAADSRHWHEQLASTAQLYRASTGEHWLCVCGCVGGRGQCIAPRKTVATGASSPDYRPRSTCAKVWRAPAQAPELSHNVE